MRGRGGGGEGREKGAPTAATSVEKSCLGIKLNVEVRSEETRSGNWRDHALTADLYRKLALCLGYKNIGSPKAFFLGWKTSGDAVGRHFHTLTD